MMILLLLVAPTSAFAAYAYTYGRTSDLSYADEGVSYANSAWSSLGFTYSSYLGSSFTEGTALNNAKSATASMLTLMATAAKYWITQLGE